MSFDLTKVVHSQSDMQPFLLRIHQAVKSVVEIKGRAKGGLMIGILAVSAVAGLALSYFCMDGTVRSIIEVATDTRHITRIRYLGDAGGWTSLTLFTVLAVKNIYERLIGEGEIIKVPEICLTWCRNNRELIVEHPKYHQQLYIKLFGLLKVYQSRCLFSQSLLSSRLLAMKVYEDSGLEQQGKKLILDKKLQPIFQTIQSELDEQLRPKHYLHRLNMGGRNIKKKGCCNLTGARIFGVVFPIIFLLNFLMSIVGEVGLGKELFVDREELTDIGHFGEWPINAAEALGAAILLNLWYLLNLGDFEITRSIYSDQIELLKDDEDVAPHNRLCQVANEELAQISKTCDNLILPEDYEFEKK